MKPFKGNIYTHYGTIMEDVCRSYVEKIYNTKVYVTGAVPWLRDEGNIVAHYSMDGIFRYKKGIDNMFDEDCNLLLEIKFPWCRSLKYKNDKLVIPRGYLKQVSYGLVVIEQADYGLFLDCICKIAPLDSMKDGDFSYSEFHDSKISGTENDQEFNNKQILAYGAIKIKCKDVYASHIYKNSLKRADISILNSLPKCFGDYKKIFDDTVVQIANVADLSDIMSQEDQ